MIRESRSVVKITATARFRGTGDGRREATDGGLSGDLGAYPVCEPHAERVYSSGIGWEGRGVLLRFLRQVDGTASVLQTVTCGPWQRNAVKKHQMHRLLRMALPALLMLFSVTAALAVATAGQKPVAVLYPDHAAPYRNIFIRVIEGIEAQTGARVESYAVSERAGMTAPEILAKLKQQGVTHVIALGRQGVAAASGLPREITVIAGCIVAMPEIAGRSFTAVSLAPDPSRLFERLKSFMPAVRRVVVVYDPQQNAWLMTLARQAARKHGLALWAIEAADRRSAVLAYQDLLININPKTDALWLPQDSTTVEETSILPLVLETAWNRSVAVFSSQATHVRRGALFALFPDYLALGRQLANLLPKSPSDRPATSSIVPFDESLLAINVRVARHLGFSADPSRQHFDLVFPE